MNRKFHEVDPLHKKTAKAAILPTRKTVKSAGYDIALNADIKLMPREQKLFWTDIKVEMLDNEFLMVVIRSSLAIKYGLTMVNNIGVIDADYYNNQQNNGNIGIPIINNSRDLVTIPAGTAIAQGIFIDYRITSDDISSNERLGGFGSTTQKE